MALSAEAAHDIAVKHRIGLSRYSSWVVRRILGLLHDTEDNLISRLARTDNESLAGQRMEALLEEVRSIQTAGYALVKDRMAGFVADLAEGEARFALRLAGVKIDPAPFATFSPLPPLEQIVAAVNSRPFQGRFLRDWMSEAEEGAKRRVRDTIRQGFVEGRPTADIVRSIRGTKAQNYKDGALEISRRGAETMVRTALTHTANTAAQAAWEANADIVKGWRFVATLDARTSLICAGLHGKTFPLGKGPQPPRHPNCRSTSVPVLEEIEGVAPFEFPSYEAWLKKQSKETQDDILGPGRAGLWRQGKVAIDRFVDNKGRVINLDQLQKADDAAFKATAKAAQAASAAPPLTTFETVALQGYTGPRYALLNQYLRGIGPKQPWMDDMTAGIDSALAKTSLKDEVTVFRGLDASGANYMSGLNLGFGSTYEDRGFVSTARTLQAAADFTSDGGMRIVIQAEAGQRGIDVSQLSAVGTGEREILFPRGSRFRVIRWDYENRTLYVRRLPD